MIILSVIGNLGADVEVREINGKRYASMRIASTQKRGGNNTTTWVSVLATYSDFENLIPYLKKGRSVFVNGEGNVKTYETKDKRTGVDVSLFASTITLCGKSENGHQQVENDQADKLVGSGEKTAYAQSNRGVTESEDELPF